jgi:hypothetical protein
MPDKLIINVPPYEGEYDFDLSGEFSYVEWRWIKQISGYMPLTWADGFRGGDPDLFLAFAAIALRRHGKITKTEVLATAEIIEEAAVDGASISYEPEAVEDIDPPFSSEADASVSASGDDTSASSEPTPENEKPSDSGTPASATGLASVQAISGS